MNFASHNNSTYSQSDGLSDVDDIQEFIIHYPKKINASRNQSCHSKSTNPKIIESSQKKDCPKSYSLDQIIKKCRDIQRQVEQQTAQKFSDYLIELMKINYMDEGAEIITNKRNSKKIKNKHKSKSQKALMGQKLIIPIQVKSNEASLIFTCMNHFYQQLSQQQLQDSYSSSQSSTVCSSNIFESYDHINIYRFQGGKIKMKEIVLDLYAWLKLHEISSDLTIVVSSCITDLSIESCEIIQKILVNSNLIIIFPTQKNFNGFQHLVPQSLQVIPFQLVNSKKIFSHYIYRCMGNQIVKPYFSPGCLKLIQEFDCFPISFNQGVRRFIYCVRSMHSIVKKLKIKLEHIKFDKLVNYIIKSLIKGFQFFSFTIKQNKLDIEIEHLMCIIDKNQEYIVVQELFRKYKTFYHSKDLSFLEDYEIVNIIRNRLIKHLREDEDLIKYAVCLQSEKGFDEKITRSQIKTSQKYENTPTKGRKNRKTSGKKNQQTGKGKQKLMTPMKKQNSKQAIEILQQQIHRILLNQTSHIRQIGRKIPWPEVKYEQRIKPQVILDLHQTFIYHKNFKDIYRFIISEAGHSLFQVADFYQNLMTNDHCSGEFMFLLKQMRLYGLIFLKQHRINPKISPLFFLKANFHNISEN